MTFEAYASNSYMRLYTNAKLMWADCSCQVQIKKIIVRQISAAKHDATSSLQGSYNLPIYDPRVELDFIYWF